MYDDYPPDSPPWYPGPEPKKGPPMTQRTDSLTCPHCNRAFCNCTPDNRTGLTPSELERLLRSLYNEVSACWGMEGTAREAFGNTNYQAVADKLEQVKAAITSATKDKP